MATYDLSQITPFITIHVGEYIKDNLKELNMTQKELSVMTGIHCPIINNIIKGKRGITPEQSALIGEAFGVSAELLYNLHCQYEMDCAKINKRVEEQRKAMQIWKIIKEYISEPFFKKIGVINNKNVADDVHDLFKVFQIKTLDEFLSLVSKPSYALFKESDKLKEDVKVKFSWVHYCYYLANQAEKLPNEFNVNDVENLITELNEIFYINKDTVNETRKTLNKYGINLVEASKHGKLPVDGISFWKGEDPTIAVTLRYKDIDNFAFTIMHELGHIVLHLQKGGDVVSDDQKESEANDFAKSALINKKIWESFWTKAKVATLPQLKNEVMLYAEKYRINPQVLMGRYKHNTGCYAIKFDLGRKVS